MSSIDHPVAPGLQTIAESTVRWHPAAPAAILQAGHTLFVCLVRGQELVLWRSAAGTVQAWENRCPHRSVRLSMGQVLGDRLSCAYHGWQFKADTGACVAIPAHPAMAAPSDVRVRVWPVFERDAMVWVHDSAAGASNRPPDRLAFGRRATVYCRTLVLRAALESVRVFLTNAGWCDQSSNDRGLADQVANHPGVIWRGQVAGIGCEWLLLEARADLTFAHVWMDVEPEAAGHRAVHAVLRQMRDRIEVIGHD